MSDVPYLSVSLVLPAPRACSRSWTDCGGTAILMVVVFHYLEQQGTGCGRRTDPDSLQRLVLMGWSGVGSLLRSFRFPNVGG